MIIHDVEQKSDEWFALRAGKMTASHATAIGNAGSGLDTYLVKKMAEFYSSGEVDFYTNKDMQRGNELEEQAIAMYSLEQDVEVQTIGFVEHNEFVGCSPDGFIGEDGGIEVKCPDDVNYFKALIGGPISSGYLWQIQMNLLITGRKWFDYVAYNPNFKKSMIIKRITPESKRQDMLREGFILGQQKILKLKKLMQ